MTCAELFSPRQDNPSGENCPFWALSNELRRILAAEATNTKGFQASLNLRSQVITHKVKCL
jgi:hypothetical protein